MVALLVNIKLMIKLIKERWKIKIIEKGKFNLLMRKTIFLSCIKREIANARLCKYENIVELYNSIELDDKFILSFELYDINLYDFIIKNPENKTDLYFIRNIFIQLNNAFEILSKKNNTQRYKA